MELILGTNLFFCISDMLLASEMKTYFLFNLYLNFSCKIKLEICRQFCSALVKNAAANIRSLAGSNGETLFRRNQICWINIWMDSYTSLHVDACFSNGTVL